MSTPAKPKTASGWLATRCRESRLDRGLRRAIKKLQQDLHSAQWETLRALIKGRLARRELLAQQRELLLLADPSAEGGRWLIAVWAAQRRDVELLAVLERLGDPADQPPTLQQYLAARATSEPAP